MELGLCGSCADAEYGPAAAGRETVDTFRCNHNPTQA
jgi:hypothetical protein